MVWKTDRIEPCRHCGKPFTRTGAVHLRCSPECVFRSKVIVGDEDECWPWPGPFWEEYGLVTANNQVFRAHRVSFVVAGNELGDLDCVLHSCDNPLCVNPNHLSKGTREQNTSDAWERGLCRKGASHYKTPFSEEDVRLIRLMALAGKSQESIGHKYNVPRSTISSIVQRRSWKHVE